MILGVAGSLQCSSGRGSLLLGSRLCHGASAQLHVSSTGRMLKHSAQPLAPALLDLIMDPRPYPFMCGCTLYSSSWPPSTATPAGPAVGRDGPHGAGQDRVGGGWDGGGPEQRQQQQQVVVMGQYGSV